MTDNPQDIRWHQRLSNYQKAFKQLTKFIEKPDLNELEEQGFIKCFEYTYELAWKTLKDYLEYQGFTDLIGSRDVVRKAFQEGLIENGDTWMAMIKSRNLTSHTYNEDTSNEIIEDICHRYYSEYEALLSLLIKKKSVDS